MARIAAVLVWFFAALLMLTIVALPINLQAQLFTTIVLVGLMAVIKLFRAEREVWRLTALAFGTAVVLRYVYWRTTSTLPPVNQPENFIPGLLLYIAEMYSVAMLALSLFVVAKPLPQRQARPEAADLPTVDVFVPTYNEEPDLLANTLAAAKDMDYPLGKLMVWLLDDGSTEQKRNSDNVLESQAATVRHDRLNALCRDLGVRYLTRARNEHAKAGNLNAGLAQSSGSLIAVFDADHAPTRGFLKETVGYFLEDPRLFLVQTPHFFLNPDPIERNLQTFERMPGENEMFYGIVQRGLDKWNASFFCGSAAILRRSALQETDGFSGRSITEDCETALSLHARGWNSIYVDKPMIAGLQPATFASFIGQRSRWAQGMMQIMRFNFPLTKAGLSIPQRLCYLSSMLFWFFPFSRLMFLAAPLFYLFFDLQIFDATGGEFLAYTLAYMAANLMMQNYLYGSFRWPWVSELYEYALSVYLAPAIVSVLVSPSKPTFKVTAKDEAITADRLSEFSHPYFLIFAALLLGMGFAGYRLYAEPYKTDVTLVVGGWNLLNLLIAGCTLGAVSERAERYLNRRVKVSRRCVFILGDERLPATIEDVSIDGARLQALGLRDRDVMVDTPAFLRFAPLGKTEEESLPVTVRHFERNGDLAFLGCRFEPSAARHHNLVADLVFADASQWSRFQSSRRHNPGIVFGTLRFLTMAVSQTWRGLSFLLLHRPAAREKG